MIFIESKSKGTADESEIKKLSKNFEKNRGNYVENIPQNSTFCTFEASNYKKNRKPGYPGFEVKKPDLPKGQKTRVPGFPGTRVPNTRPFNVIIVL